MKNLYLFLLIICFLLLSCSETKHGELLEIQVDINQNISFSLSEIVEDLITIEPELTDESLINTDEIRRIIISENHVITMQSSHVLVFAKDGKYIRSIGSRGQGPGEYTYIGNMAMDETKKHLYLSTWDNKIKCISVYSPKFIIFASSNIKTE